MTDRPNPAADPPVTLETITQWLERVYARMTAIEDLLAEFARLSVRHGVRLAELRAEFRNAGKSANGISLRSAGNPD